MFVTKTPPLAWLLLAATALLIVCEWTLIASLPGLQPAHIRLWIRVGDAVEALVVIASVPTLILTLWEYAHEHQEPPHRRWPLVLMGCAVVTVLLMAALLPPEWWPLRHLDRRVIRLAISSGWIIGFFLLLPIARGDHPRAIRIVTFLCMVIALSATVHISVAWNPVRPDLLWLARAAAVVNGLAWVALWPPVWWTWSEWRIPRIDGVHTVGLFALVGAVTALGTQFIRTALPHTLTPVVYHTLRIGLWVEQAPWFWVGIMFFGLASSSVLGILAKKELNRGMVTQYALGLSLMAMAGPSPTTVVGMAKILAALFLIRRASRSPQLAVS